jgi:hypothetical protein
LWLLHVNLGGWLLACLDNRRRRHRCGFKTRKTRV